MPIHGVDVAGVARSKDAAQNLTAHSAWPPARTHHDERAGREQRSQTRHVGGPFAFINCGYCRLVRHEAAGHMHGALLGLAMHRESKTAEDPKHAVVLGEGLGHEPTQTRRPGDCCKVFEQQRADAIC